jgi:GrpB-like predicted nucleotidyltransferase (UPF0157 family)
MTRIIEVFPSDPAWVQNYHDELTRFSSVLGPNLVAAHHIGSTAVPGLAAKPIIDILLVVRAFDVLDTCNNAMGELGYTAKGENGIPGRRYFQRQQGEQHLVHLHAFEEGHPEITQLLNFRDYMIAHPDAAQEYEVLKRKLAAEFRHMPVHYLQGKADFIRIINERAAAWRSAIDPVDGNAL